MVESLCLGMVKDTPVPPTKHTRQTSNPQTFLLQFSEPAGTFITLGALSTSKTGFNITKLRFQTQQQFHTPSQCMRAIVHRLNATSTRGRVYATRLDGTLPLVSPVNFYFFSKTEMSQCDNYIAYGMESFICEGHYYVVRRMHS